MSHTPGPWSVDSSIAAAQEMLAILEELRESSTCCGTYDLLEETTWASPDLADRIESAIRKARGEV